MAVLTIMGTTFCFSSLPENIISENRLDSVIDRLVINLRWARMKAILDNKDYNFKIYAEDSGHDGNCRYIIYHQKSDDSKVIVRRGEYPAEYILYKNLNLVKINNFYDRIKFTGYGTAVNGTIGLENENGKLTKIVVSQMGRIRIEEN